MSIQESKTCTTQQLAGSFFMYYGNTIKRNSTKHPRSNL